MTCERITKFGKINEKLGVPEDVNPWFVLLYDTIVDQIIDFRDVVKEDPTDGLDIMHTGDEDVEVNTAMIHIDNFNDARSQYVSVTNLLKIRAMDVRIGVTIVPLYEKHAF